MSSSSEQESEEPSMILMSGAGWDIVMTPAGSAIASGDADPIMLQNLN